MSNPDEKTAVEQFGKGDKYFGVGDAAWRRCRACRCSATARSRASASSTAWSSAGPAWDEPVDEGLLGHHERTILPLLRRRAEFAGSRDFLLYDVETGDDGPAGGPRGRLRLLESGPGGERSLVVFHNRYAEVRGWARDSCTYAERGSDGQKQPARTTLGAALELTPGPGRWLVMHDAMSGLEPLRAVDEIIERGLWADLPAYGCRVYVDLHEVVDGPEEPWSRLADRLDGRAVPSLADALAELRLEPEHDRARSRLAAALAGDPAGAPSPGSQVAAAAGSLEGLDIDGLRLRPVIARALAGAGWEPADIDRGTGLVVALAAASAGLRALDEAAIRGWFADPRIRAGLRVNAWDGVEYFEREAWLLWLAAVGAAILAAGGRPTLARQRVLATAAAGAGYDLTRLLAAASSRRPATRRLPPTD